MESYSKNNELPASENHLAEAGLFKRKARLIIPFKEAKKQKLIRVTSWGYHTEPMKMRRKMEFTVLEWMKNYSEQMNQDCQREFMVVEHRTKHNYFAVFAKKVKE